MKGPNKVIQIDKDTLGLILEPSNKICLIDKKNYDLVKNYRWILHTSRTKHTTNFYAKAHIFKNNKRTMIYIHRLILNFPDDLYTDHIDNNGLNNTESNLRLATNQQNQQNSHSGHGLSKHKGVYWNKVRLKWQAQIRHNNKRMSVGYFLSEIDAAKAYNKAAIKLFGEFANLNKIEE
jgi:hypothetical protein